MRRAAKYAGVTAFVLVEVIVLFGGAIVASVRCCAAAGAVGPVDATDWGALAIFAVVMIVPAAMIALGVAMIVETLTCAATALKTRHRTRSRKGM